STGKEASITIQNTTTLSDDEVERMVADAKSHAEEGRKVKELAEAKNQLDGLRLTARQARDAAPEGVTDEQQQTVDAARTAARKRRPATCPRSCRRSARPPRPRRPPKNRRAPRARPTPPTWTRKSSTRTSSRRAEVADARYD